MSRRPLYVRLLRLRHVQLSGWQRALLRDGALVLAVVLVLADLASAWLLLALPLAVAVVVKAHDIVAGQLRAQPPRTPGDATTPGTTTAPTPRRGPAPERRP